MTGSRLLVEHEGDDLLYVGPLEPAKSLAKRDRVVVERLDEGVYRVNLCYSEPDYGAHTNREDSIWAVTAEWGSSSESEDEAWRYAIAAYLGPIDDEYPGDDYVLSLMGFYQLDYIKVYR